MWLSTIRLVARRYGSCCLVSMVFFHLFFFVVILVMGSCCGSISKTWDVGVADVRLRENSSISARMTKGSIPWRVNKQQDVESCWILRSRSVLLWNYRYFTPCGRCLDNVQNSVLLLLFCFVFASSLLVMCLHQHLLRHWLTANWWCGWRCRCFEAGVMFWQVVVVGLMFAIFFFEEDGLK